MRILGRAGRNKPGRSGQIRSLRDHQHRAILRISPESLGPLNGTLLDSAVGRVRRIGSAKTAKPARHRIGDVDERIAAEVESAVVEAELALGRVGFHAHNGAAGMHERKVRIKRARAGRYREHNRVRAGSDHVAANAIAPHAMADHTEVLGQRTLIPASTPPPIFE